MQDTDIIIGETEAETCWGRVLVIGRSDLVGRRWYCEILDPRECGWKVGGRLYLPASSLDSVPSKEQEITMSIGGYDNANTGM